MGIVVQTFRETGNESIMKILLLIVLLDSFTTLNLLLNKYQSQSIQLADKVPLISVEIFALLLMENHWNALLELPKDQLSIVQKVLKAKRKPNIVFQNSQ